MRKISIEAKHEFLREVSDGISDKLPSTHADTALSVIADTMGNYEIESTGTQDDAAEKEDCLKAFLDARRVEGRSEKTIERYEYVIHKFYGTCERGPRRTTVYHIRRFLAERKDAGNSDRTIEGYRAILYGYFQWLTREGLITANPVGNIATIHYEKKVREPYSSVDLYKLHECCNVERGGRCTTDRNKAIIAVLESTGCRISELCGMNRTDINFNDAECVVHGKGNKNRVVYLDRVAIMLVQRYLDSRTDDLPALFIGKRSDRMTPGGVRHLLKLFEEKAGITNVHPHRFRRTLATNMIQRGMPIQEVSILLGHERLDTTMTYCYTNQDSIKSSYYRYS